MTLDLATPTQLLTAKTLDTSNGNAKPCNDDNTGEDDDDTSADGDTSVTEPRDDNNTRDNDGGDA